MGQEFDPKEYQKDVKEAEGLNKDLDKIGFEYVNDTGYKIGEEFLNLQENIRQEKNNLLIIHDRIKSFIENNPSMMDLRMSFAEFTEIVDAHAEIYGAKEYKHLHDLIESKTFKINYELSVQDFLKAIENRLDELRNLLDPGPEAPNLDLQS